MKGIGQFKSRVQAWVVMLLMLVAFAKASAGDSISVYIFLSETCPICQNQTLTLRQLYSTYAGRGIAFTGLFPNQELSGKESIQKFGRKYKIEFELRKDERQQWVKQFGATVTPQVFVVRNYTGEVLYSGKIDNGFEGIGKKRQVITEHYLRDALQQIIENKVIAVKETPPVGCFIVRPD